MSRQTREVYAVRWNKEAACWVCPQLNLSRPSQMGLVRVLATRLRRRWQFAHVPCQLKVFRKNGRIGFERTYGRDPKRFPG